ncbi:unnamed protein product [Ilex paraguariensis]|uniref:RNase H type-1 domain-containing protein n=1 Tax=Ilex paraguariensis TaxID=185542 RepID=A0ABC8SPY3_9AQUA
MGVQLMIIPLEMRCSKKAMVVDLLTSSNVVERAIVAASEVFQSRGMQKPFEHGQSKCSAGMEPASTSRQALFGVVVRDQMGTLITGAAGTMRASSALSAEAWAVRCACAMAVVENFHEVIVESDSKVLIEALHRGPTSLIQEVETFQRIFGFMPVKFLRTDFIL